jgi:hypothetical protein
MWFFASRLLLFLRLFHLKFLLSPDHLGPETFPKVDQARTLRQEKEYQYYHRPE